MTAPFPQLPNIQQGNVFQDIGSAVSSFAKGLQEERTRRREEAMKTAMMQLQMARVMRPQRPIRELAIGLNGQLTYNYRDPETMELLSPEQPSQAPSSQYFYPGPNGELVAVNRQVPGAPAVPVQGLAPGQVPPGQVPQAPQVPQAGAAPQPQVPQQPAPPAPRVRDVPNAPMTVEGPGGPVIGGLNRRSNVFTPAVGPNGQPVQPRADEQDERRARDAFEMIQARGEISQLNAKNPNAYNEAAAYLSSRNFLDSIKIIGGPLDQVLAASQSSLSSEAAQYVRAFTQLASARAFSRGGATLTANEIRWAMDALAPRMFADDATRQTTERLIQTAIMGNIAGNPAWQRYREVAKALGFDESMMSVIPPTGVAPSPLNINPLTGRPRRH